MQALLGIAVFAGWVLFLSFGFGPRTGHLDWRQAHHGYWGGALVLLGLTLYGAGAPWTGLVVAAVGDVVLVDDALQHAVQRFGRRPAFRSPLHGAYAWAYGRWAWVRALNAWADRWLA